MLKSSVPVWVNSGAHKQVNITPSTTCNDIIQNVAAQYNLPKRVLPHLELHVYHGAKGMNLEGGI